MLVRERVVSGEGSPIPVERESRRVGAGGPDFSPRGKFHRLPVETFPRARAQPLFGGTVTDPLAKLTCPRTPDSCSQSTILVSSRLSQRGGRTQQREQRTRLLAAVLFLMLAFPAMAQSFRNTSMTTWSPGTHSITATYAGTGTISAATRRFSRRW